MSETKKYILPSGEYTEFRPTVFFNNRVNGSFDFDPCGERGANWLEDSEWMDLVKDIIKISNDIIVVIWNGIYQETDNVDCVTEAHEFSIYKGILK